MFQLLTITLDGYHLNYWYYSRDGCIQLDPPLLFGPNHGYDTRQASHFVIFYIFRYSIAFGQKILDLKRQCGGIVFLTHFSIVIFNELCLMIFLISTVYNNNYYVYIFLLLNVCVYSSGSFDVKRKFISINEVICFN